MNGLLVIGCGNPLAADDSAGVEIVARLRATGRHATRFLAVEHPGVELLDEFEQAEAVLFVDAVCSGDRPGAASLLPADEVEFELQPLARASAHGWSLGELLRLARSLGRRLPPVYLLGIEAANMTPGCARTAEIEGAIARVVERFSEIEAHLAGGELCGGTPGGGNADVRR